MAQVLDLVKGDAKTLRITVRTDGNNRFNLTGYDTIMYLYEDSDNPDDTSALMTWDSADPTRAKIIDPTNGEVEYYIKGSDTGALERVRQYLIRAKVFTDSEHIYTIYEAFLQIS